MKKSLDNCQIISPETTKKLQLVYERWADTTMVYGVIGGIEVIAIMPH